MISPTDAPVQIFTLALSCICYIFLISLSFSILEGSFYKCVNIQFVQIPTFTLSSVLKVFKVALTLVIISLVSGFDGGGGGGGEVGRTCG